MTWIARQELWPQGELPLRVLAARQGGIVTLEQALGSGLTPRRIRTLVEHGDWARPYRGLFHAEAAAEGGLPLLARLWAAHLRAGPESVVGSGSAARALGIQGLPERMEAAELVLPPGRARRSAQGLRLHYWPLAAAESTRLGRLPLTTPARTLADTLLQLPGQGGSEHSMQGLSVLDSALRMRLVSPAELASVARTVRGRPGASAALRLLPLADGRSASPAASRIRMLCLDAGLPPDQLAHRVRDRAGRCRATVDLAWTEGLSRPLFVQVDGLGPATAADEILRERRDRNRLERLTDARVLRYGWADTVAGAGGPMLQEIRETLGACRS